MFSRFMIATDLSHASFALVRSLKGLQAFGAKQCLLLTCLSMGETTVMAFSLSYGIVESNLQKQKRILEEQGFVTTTELVLGFAKSEINRIAAERKYPLIVVGSRGRPISWAQTFSAAWQALLFTTRRRLCSSFRWK